VTKGKRRVLIRFYIKLAIETNPLLPGSQPLPQHI
jgi:hypothetical protein